MEVTLFSNGRVPQARKTQCEKTGMNTFDYCVFLPVSIVLYELVEEFWGWGNGADEKTLSLEGTESYNRDYRDYRL